jgi:uncharacterized membrane protein YcgQ (UPF0703/DUF1980 family)
LLSAVIVFTIIYVDIVEAENLPVFLQIITKYIAPLMLCLHAFYILPWLIYKIVQYERHERKTEKEESFMHKNSFMMILNFLILPFIVCSVLSTWNTSLANTYVNPSTPKFPKNVLNITKEDL